MRHRVWMLLAVAFVGVSAAGCGNDDPPEVLIADPMSRPVIAQATELRHITTGGSGPFIQSSPARSITAYEVPHEHLEAAAADLLDQAAQAGWELEPGSTTVPGGELASNWTGVKDDEGLGILILFDTSSSVPDGERDYTVSSIQISVLG